MGAGLQEGREREVTEGSACLQLDGGRRAGRERSGEVGRPISSKGDEIAKSAGEMTLSQGLVPPAEGRESPPTWEPPASL